MEGRGIESRRQLLYFERTTKTREKERDEFGNEDRNEMKNKARPQSKRPSTRGASAIENETKKQKRLDPKILSVNERLDSKDVD